MDWFRAVVKAGRAAAFMEWVNEAGLFLGRPGTGKSHLAQAIGVAVIQQGHRVCYREAHVLLEELAEAQLDGTRKAYLAHLTSVPSSLRPPPRISSRS